jgi:hypothetical protein
MVLMSPLYLLLHKVDVGEDLEEDNEEAEDAEGDEEDEEEEEEEEDEDEAEFDAEASPTTTDKQATLDARARFAANLLLLNGAELGYVVRSIECECPAAMENGPPAVPEKMEILVDALGPTLFNKLCQFANEKAAARRMKLNISTAPPPINDISNKRKRKR